jgi:hypothetical protein
MSLISDLLSHKTVIFSVIALLKKQFTLVLLQEITKFTLVLLQEMNEITLVLLQNYYLWLY